MAHLTTNEAGMGQFPFAAITAGQAAQQRTQAVEKVQERGFFDRLTGGFGDLVTALTPVAKTGLEIRAQERAEKEDRRRRRRDEERGGSGLDTAALARFLSADSRGSSAPPTALILGGLGLVAVIAYFAMKK